LVEHWQKVNSWYNVLKTWWNQDYLIIYIWIRCNLAIPNLLEYFS
jgi:hypothetical protein